MGTTLAPPLSHSRIPEHQSINWSMRWILHSDPARNPRTAGYGIWQAGSPCCVAASMTFCPISPASITTTR